jgi:hypothetical protein
MRGLYLLLGVILALSLPAWAAPPPKPDADRPPGKKVVEIEEKDLPRPVIWWWLCPPCPPCPKDPPPNGGTPPPGGYDTMAARAVIRFGNSQCTASVIGPRQANGRWHLFSAAHCMAAGARGTARLMDGRTVNVRVVAHERRSDIAWLETESDAISSLPSTRLATTSAAAGTRASHAGFCQRTGGKRMPVTVQATPDANAQVRFFGAVCPGDSGGPVWRDDTGEVLASVCCTTNLQGNGNFWGGGSVRALQLRPGPKPAELAKGWAAAASEDPGHPEATVHPTLHIAGDH